MQKKFIPFAAFFVALLLVLAHLGARMTAVPVFSFAAEKRVFLTFDDGPSTVVTGRVLDILQEENVKATFFIVGDRVGGRKETLRRIANEGHTLGVHSQTHEYGKIYSSDEAFLKAVDACAETIREVTGVTARVYRFPGGGGEGKERRSALLRKKGYLIVGWNAVCGDEEIRGADKDTLLKTAIKTAGGKATVVLLLHDSAPHRATADALPAIIAHFREAGYAFCAY